MNHDREVRCAWAAFVLASALYVAPAAALYRDDVPPPEVPTEPAPPKDNTPSCKDAYPYPYPYWIESSHMADVIERELKLNPQTSKVTFAIYANDPSEAMGSTSSSRPSLAPMKRSSISTPRNPENDAWSASIARPIVPKHSTCWFRPAGAAAPS